MSTTCIYGLFDSRNPDVIMYVGKGLERRAQYHWKLFLRRKKAVNSLLLHWFEKMKTDGIEPMWRFLEENVINWQDAEKAWIVLCKSSNPSLCNLAAGGNQPPISGGFVCSEAKKIAGRNNLVIARNSTTPAQRSEASRAGIRSIFRSNPDHSRKAGVLGGQATSLWMMKNPQTASENARKAALASWDSMRKNPERVRERAIARGKLGGVKGGPSACHKRWHIDRGIFNPNCSLCQ